LIRTALLQHPQLGPRLQAAELQLQSAQAGRATSGTYALINAALAARRAGVALY